MERSNRPVVIGWKEYADFPEWGIDRVKVKIDTGARTTALDATMCVLVADAHLGRVADLTVSLSGRRRERRETRIRSAIVDEIRIRNSFGRCQTRLVVETLLRLGPVEKRIRLTVADRSRMLFPVILGRKALEKDFLVDVSRKYVLSSRLSG